MHMQCDSYTAKAYILGLQTSLAPPSRAQH